ncbi:centriolar coiled-coil protein of 110 kDa-like [Pholidichthys leucotaenia]
MCGGCPEMESYEEFCLRSLATLQEEGKFKKTELPCSLKTGSVICFYGRAVLSPVLSAEQHKEMCGHRQRAVQLEADQQKQQRNKLLTRVQAILDQAQVSKVECEEVDTLPVSKSAAINGYTLVTDSPGLSKDPGFGLQKNDLPVTPCTETPILNGYRPEEEVRVMNQEKSEEEDEDEEDISLDSLLKRSREYVKREHSQQESKVTHSIAQTPPPEAVAVNEEKSCSPAGDQGVEFGFSLHHSPVTPPHIHHPAPYDSCPQKSVCLPHSLPEHYPSLPSPDSSIIPCRRRPRPVSTGNIHISFPIGPADLIPRSPGRTEEGAGMADWKEALSASSSSVDRHPVGREGVGRSTNYPSSHCGTSPVQNCSHVSSMEGYDHLVPGFRRRCHTLDSQRQSPHSGVEHIDRSQERVPRFMAGVTMLTPSHRTPSGPLNQSYEVEDPTPSLQRPCVTPDFCQGPNSGRKTANTPRNTTEIQVNKTETQWRAQVLEDMQRRLEKEHAFQMALLLAEQEREQQRLCLELEDAGKRLKEQGHVRPLSADVSAWTPRPMNDICPIMSPSCPGLSPTHATYDRSSGHSIGFPSPVPSCVSSPSLQPPMCLWGSSWTTNKPWTRQSLVLTAEHQKAFCQIGALIRGFLTRRLLKTEKVKYLRQTVVDTREFIKSFQTEAQQKKVSSSAQDLSLQERVRAQLRAALYDIHDIFFDMPLGDRLALLQQDRELRAERKLRDMEKAKSSKDKVILSAATQRSLDRKKRVGESPAQTRKVQQKPKSPTTNRVLKQTQGQNSPATGQLNRQGSWYRKTPEERVRRSDSLKKQHSLG